MNPARVALVEGEEIEVLLAGTVARWRPEVRMAGVLSEGHGIADRACNAGYLRSVASGARFAMFRETVKSANACHLDGGSVLTASAAVEQDIAAGCELVVLGKFGRLEAAGKSLLGAFRVAIAAGIPVLTSVSPSTAAALARLAGASVTTLPSQFAALDAWRRAVLAQASGA